MPRPRSNRWTRCATSSRPTRPGRCSTSRCRASPRRTVSARRCRPASRRTSCCGSWRPASPPTGWCWPAPSPAAARARLRRRGLPGDIGRGGGAVGQVFAQRMRGLVRQRRRSEVRVVRRVRNRADARALVARTETPVSVQTDWEDSNIDPPIDLAMQDAGKPMLAAPQSWKRFDLARYQIRPDETAFGVRAGWSEGYSGGGADFEALYLFRIEGRALRVVFARPMAFTRCWPATGTRRHARAYRVGREQHAVPVARQDRWLLRHPAAPAEGCRKQT